MHFALMGTAAAQECSSLDLDVTAEKAVVAVTDDELDRAEALALQAIASLPCADRVPEPEDLATLWQVLGAVAVLRGRPEAAEAPLRQSAQVFPMYFNRRLGDDVRAAWEAAGTAPMGMLSVGPIPEGGTLYVDGVVRESGPLPLGVGDHLVQVTSGAEVIWVAVVTVDGSPDQVVNTGLPCPGGPWRQRARILAASAAGVYAVGTLGMNMAMRTADSLGFLGMARTAQITLAVGVAPLLGVAAGWCFCQYHQANPERYGCAPP